VVLFGKRASEQQETLAEVEMLTLGLIVAAAVGFVDVVNNS
jgi:hypothetical protein